MTSTAHITELYKNCRACGESKLAVVENFYMKDKGTGRFDTTCRSCRLDPVQQRSRARRYIDYGDTETKVCRRCGVEKPRAEFYAKTNGRPGAVVCYCSQCCSEDVNARAKVRIRQDWLERMLKYARTNRLKRRGVHDRLNFDREYLLRLYADQRGRCWWTGVELHLDTIGLLTSVSLDRLDNTKGYLKGNVVLACRGANLARGAASPDEFKEFIRMIKEARHG